jgi:hypothetical protein
VKLKPCLAEKKFLVQLVSAIVFFLAKRFCYCQKLTFSFPKFFFVRSHDFRIVFFVRSHDFRIDCRGGKCSGAGLPDFSFNNIPKQEKICQISTKYAKWSKNMLNDYKMDQLAIKYIYVPTSSITYNTLQNLLELGYWFETMPSGNPVQELRICGVTLLLD